MFDARISMKCHEWIHKTYAPSCFPGLVKSDLSDVMRVRAENGVLHEHKVLQFLQNTFPEEFIRVAGENRQLETLNVLRNSDFMLVAGAEFGSESEREMGLSVSGKIGKPDLLLRVSDGWIPIDVKSHGSLKDGRKKYSFKVSLEELLREDFPKQDLSEGSLKQEDASQLAHYWTQLDALGLASDSLLIGVIGRDGEQAVFQSISTTSYANGKKSALEAYLESFASAVKVLESAVVRNENPTLPPVATPRLDQDCKDCEFQKACLAEMKAMPGGGHPTLVSGVTPNVLKKDFEGVTSISELYAKSKENQKFKKIELKAQAWLENRVIPLVDESELEIPTFDIEIDIDLENSQAALFGEDGEGAPQLDVVFQYGWVKHRRFEEESWESASVTGVFEDFRNSMEADYDVQLGMWNWCQSQIAEAESAGKSIGIFHYSHHELGWWRKFVARHAGKPGVPSLEEVEHFIATYMIDLRKTAEQFAFPASGYSIKDLAPLADFQWEVEQAGGANATLEFLAAVDPSDSVRQKQAQEWLTSYNRDDARATMALRNWLRQSQIARD